jgi:hypothetical protein
LWITEISDGAITACSSRSCKWSINPIPNQKPCRESHLCVTISFVDVWSTYIYWESEPSGFI